MSTCSEWTPKWVGRKRVSQVSTFSSVRERKRKKERKKDRERVSESDRDGHSSRTMA